MTILKPALITTVITFMAFSTAHAQTQADDIVGQVFSEVEKRIIREHYGTTAQSANDDTSAPKWAVKDIERARHNDDDDDNDTDTDNDGERDKPKKDKSNKNKSNTDKDKAKGKSGDLPPGLAKREQLPPGLAKQLRDKGRLPPGIAKRDLPADLAAKLPTRPADQDVTVVDGDVVLVDTATGIILDILKDVVTTGANGATVGTTNPDGTLVPPGDQNGQNSPAEPSLLDSVLKSIFGNSN